MRVWLMSLMVIVALAGACGSDDGGSAFPVDSGADDVSGGGVQSDAAASDSDTTSAAPIVADGTDFAIPYPDGGIDLLAEVGLSPPGQRQLAYPRERYDELVAFYDQWADGQPGEVTRSETGDQIGWVVFGSDDASMVGTVTITPDSDAGSGDDLITFVLLISG